MPLLADHSVEISPARTDGFRADVQGMRALAVLLVVIYHAELPLPGGYIGVDVFFVVSGFVITGMLRNELSSSNRISFREFYARRARRLLPSLALVTVVTLIISAVILPVTGTLQKTAYAAAATSVFSANLYFFRFGQDYFNPDWLNPFLHMWSLAVEEQIYFVFPLFVFLVWKWGRGRQVAVGLTSIGVALVSGVSFALAALVLWAPHVIPVPFPDKFAFYLPFTRFWEFGIGALVALFPNLLIQRDRRVRTSIGVFGFVAIFSGALTYDSGTVFPGPAALLPVFGTAALILAGSAGGPIPSLLSAAPLVWIGGLSYGWYLWHWPAIVLTRSVFPDWPGLLIVAAFGSLLLAVVMGKFIESPFRYNRRIVGWRAISLTGVAVVVPLALAAGVFHGANKGFGLSELQLAVATESRSRAERDGCLSTRMQEGCWYASSGEGSVVLLGDSHAGAISDAVAEAAADEGFDYGVWLRPNCSLILEQSELSAGSAVCENWSRAALFWVREIEPDYVVIASSGVGYTGSPEGVVTYMNGLGESVREILSNGSRVVLISTVPSFSESGIGSASVLQPSPSPATLSFATTPQWRQRLRADEISFARHPDVSVIDSVLILCGPTGMCSQRPGNSWEYRDTNHLSLAGALRLLPSLRESLIRY